MVATKRGAKAHNDKHRRTHRLVQAWVSPELMDALDGLAKKEGRTRANFVRRELSRITGVPE